MTDTTLIDELENMLGVPFTKKYIRKNMFRIEEFGIAAEFLRSVFESIKLPPKTEKNEIRPGFYRSPAPWMWGGGPRIDSVPTASVKQVLLYSDAVAIDMLPILGRLRISVNTLAIGIRQTTMPWERQHQQSMVGEVEQNLCEIVEYSDLIRHRIIIPFISSSAASQKSTGTSIDPLFWSRPEAESYITRMRSEIDCFTSNDIKRPFYNAILSEVPCVDSNRVSWNDILSLRRDEEIFQEWRNLVHSILNDLYNRKDEFTDTEREFQEVSRERLREWGEKLEVQRMRRSAFNAFFGGARQVSIQLIGAGLAAAAVDAAITGNSKTAAALAGGAVVAGLQNTGSGIITTLGEVWRAIASHEERLSLEHHILALGL